MEGPDPRRLVARVINLPTGVLGRHRPLYGLNIIDRVRGRTIEGVVRNKVVMVTGASSGIGAETTRRLAKAGATVLLVARRVDKLESLCGEIRAQGGAAHVHQADLSDLDDVDRMAAKALADHGHIDVLVNNAGRSIRRSIDLSYDRFHDYQRTMQLNYFGAVKLILNMLPTMRERKCGHIVNVSSAGVQAHAPHFSAYVASKAALDAFCEVAQAEVQADNVKFTTIYMPLVRTPMIAPTAIYRHFPALTPEDAGALVCEAITFQPRHIGTLGTTMLGVGNTLSPGAIDAIRGFAYGLFPDSSAAKGKSDDGTESAEGLNIVHTVFTRIFRHVHW